MRKLPQSASVPRKLTRTERHGSEARVRPTRTSDLVLASLFLQLDTRQLLQASCVCRRWAQLIDRTLIHGSPSLTKQAVYLYFFPNGKSEVQLESRRSGKKTSVAAGDSVWHYIKWTSCEKLVWEGHNADALALFRCLPKYWLAGLKVLKIRVEELLEVTDDEWHNLGVAKKVWLAMLNDDVNAVANGLIKAAPPLDQMSVRGIVRLDTSLENLVLHHWTASLRTKRIHVDCLEKTASLLNVTDAAVEKIIAVSRLRGCGIAALRVNDETPQLIRLLENAKLAAVMTLEVRKVDPTLRRWISDNRKYPLVGWGLSDSREWFSYKSSMVMVVELQNAVHDEYDDVDSGFAVGFCR